MRGGGERRASGGHGRSSFEKGHLFVADDLGGDFGNASAATVVVVKVVVVDRGRSGADLGGWLGHRGRLGEFAYEMLPLESPRFVGK